MVRKGNKSLLMKHVAALLQFRGRYLAFKFQAQMKPGSSFGKDYILREITKEKFEEYFENWRRVQTDPEARQCVSPYEM